MVYYTETKVPNSNGILYSNKNEQITATWIYNYVKQHEYYMWIHFYNIQKQAILNDTVQDAFPGDKTIKKK